MDKDDTITLNGFDVVAIPGHGVYIVGEGGSCWCVGGVPDTEETDNGLAQAYLDAVS